MNGSKSSFVIAAGVSLAVHAAVFLTLPRYRVADPGAAWAAGQPVDRMTVVLQPEPKPPPAPEEESLDEFEMGDDKGKGFASHDIPDPLEAIAPEADADQAYLSRDPAGVGDEGADAAIVRAQGEGTVRGQAGGAPPPPVAAMIAPPTATSLAPFGINPEMTLPRVVPKAVPDSLLAVQSGESKEHAGDEEVAQAVEAPAKLIDPTPPAEPQPDAVVTPVKPQLIPAPVFSPGTGGSTAAGKQQPSADPARMSDSESDPFSRLGTATFRDGRLDIRFGRKVKTRKPKLLIAGQLDLLSLQRVRVVLKIDIDATGKVTGVDVVKSSGSNEIDQPTRVAVYDWWFEPKKDATGRAVADQVQFTIGWR
jgi:TonB family protein